MSLRDLLPHLGLNINGDVGGLTVYTKKNGRMVAYPSAPALKPPTPRQATQRHRFRLAMHGWWLLSEYDRLKYQQACDQLSLCMVGHNLWICLCFQPTDELWQTIQAQSGFPLSPPLHV
jgi:hypothetical protein